MSKYNVIDKKTDKHTGPVADPDVQNWAQKYAKPDRQTYRKIDENTIVQDWQGGSEQLCNGDVEWTE